MAELLADLGASLAALHADLSDQMERLSVVVRSEFGRRVRENGELGTDHGHGGALLLLGGGMNGERVHEAWPGLEPEQLVGPGDLAITTDYRNVLAEIVRLCLGNPDLAGVFPGYAPQAVGIARGRV